MTQQTVVDGMTSRWALATLAVLLVHGVRAAGPVGSAAATHAMLERRERRKEAVGATITATSPIRSAVPEGRVSRPSERGCRPGLPCV